MVIQVDLFVKAFFLVQKMSHGARIPFQFGGGDQGK